jgi:hypothetical protein
VAKTKECATGRVRSSDRHHDRTPRSPELIVFATLRPVMFVLLFVDVFGGAIEIPNYPEYDQFLIPGIFAQSRAAVLIGRTVSDLARKVFTLVVMLAVSFAVGFRFEGSVIAALGATLLLLFSYSTAWTAGCNRSRSTTRSRSRPTPAERCTTASTRTTTPGWRSRGRSGSSLSLRRGRRVSSPGRRWRRTGRLSDGAESEVSSSFPG